MIAGALGFFLFFFQRPGWFSEVLAGCLLGCLVGFGVLGCFDTFPKVLGVFLEPFRR